METVLNVLHVVTAVFIVGPMAILPMTAMRALRAGERGQVATLARSTSVVSWASLLVAVLGFGALGLSDPKKDLSVGTPWVLASLLLYLAALATNVLVVVPALRTAGDVTAAAGPADTTAAPPVRSELYGRVAASSGTAALLLAAVVVLMVWKP
jgi:uncharacterized membrane protein